ncbi:MAG: hypothetical protein WC732_05410 [Candidatus Omnitrophota bacterium]
MHSRRIIFKLFITIGLSLSLLATLFLYWGAKEMPWDLQTFSGESTFEKRFYGARNSDNMVGIYLLFFGFAFQLIGAMFQKE